MAGCRQDCPDLKALYDTPIPLLAAVEKASVKGITERGITRLMGLAARFEVLRVAILPAVFAPFPGRRFLIGGEKLLRSQFEGALHRRDGTVVPHALQVRMTIRQPWHGPGLLGGGCRRHQRGCDHNGKTSH
jgi:hypothetical protein